MKKIISLLLIMAFTFTAFSCNSKKLETPANVKLSEAGEITWNEVANAEVYVVTINDKEYKTETAKYDARSFMANDFTYCVRATAKGYKDSLDSEVFSHQGSGINPDVPGTDITVAIDGPSEVMSGRSIELKKVISGFDRSAHWDIVEGNEFVESLEEKPGKRNTVVLTAKKVTGDKLIKVRCTSNLDSSAYGEKVIRIVVKPDLTQGMIDALKGNKIMFDGYMNIELYDDEGIIESTVPEVTTVTNMKTKMDGTNWYAEYETGIVDKKGEIYYRNVDNLAQEIHVGYMNDEVPSPMLDKDGEKITWENSGLYNNFNNLIVEDFRFNEKTWLYEYKGSDDKLVERMVSSANPYDFMPTGFGLLIDENEILGITAKSKPSYTVEIGYRAEQEIFMSLTCGEEVVVPVIKKYETLPEHALLKEALENMRGLKNYTLNFTEVTSNLQTHENIQNGYTESIVDGLCYFAPYEIEIEKNGTQTKRYIEDREYGFKRIDENFYNTFVYNTKTESYTAERAYKGNMDDELPSFEFAAELFMPLDMNDGETTAFMVSPDKMPVASMFYNDSDADLNMYGLFASVGYFSNVPFTPFVFVKKVDGKPYITDAAFFFNMGIINGVIEIKYSDFGSTVPPQGDVNFEPRKLTNVWDDTIHNKFVITADMNTPGTKDDIEDVTPTEYFGKFLKTPVEDIPCFDSAIGDTFLFGISTKHTIAKGNIANATLLMYKVDIDLDFTIDSSLIAVDKYLKGLGYTRDNKGRYKKLTLQGVHFEANDATQEPAYDADCYLVIETANKGLDLNIYIWEEFIK